MIFETMFKKKNHKSFLFFTLTLSFGVFQGCASAVDGGKASAVSEMPPKSALIARTIPFSPTFKSKLEDAYPDAFDIYDSSPRASQGVYRCSGLVFVIVVIDTRREQLEYVEGTAMLRAKALVREAFPTLPSYFKARSRLVEKELDDDTGIYRYALVFRERDIKRIAGQ